MLGILDELFPTDPEWLDPFCGRMAAYGLKWVAQFRVDRIERGVLGKLKDAGLIAVSYGIESASEPILRSMRKRITLPQIESALAATRQAGIGIQGNLLFGDPAETPETAEESIGWWERNAAYRLNMNFVVPYPGSAIYKDSVARGLIPDPLEYVRQGCPPLNMTAMSEARLEAVGARIAQAKAGHRFFAGEAAAVDLGPDPAKGGRAARLTAVCPHCGWAGTYERIHVRGLHVFSVSCRSCRQRYDIRPTVIPEQGRQAARLAGEVGRAAAARVPLAVAPCLFPPTFGEYMRTLCLDLETLPVRAFLDERPQRVGTLFADRIPVLALDREVLRGELGDCAVLVLPCHGHEALATRLLELGLEPERLLAVTEEGEE